MDSLAQTNKICTRCRSDLPLGKFAKSRKNSDGRQFWCRKCNSEFVYNRRRIKRRTRQSDPSSWAVDLLNSVRSRSSARSEVTDLTKEWIERQYDLQGGKCFYLGIQMHKYAQRCRSPFKASLDRMDSSVGYLTSNVVLCCVGANLAKSSCDINHFKEFIDAIKGT